MTCTVTRLLLPRMEFSRPASKCIDLLWVARCHPVKRPHLFLDLAERLPQARCRMICSIQDETLWRSVNARAQGLQNVEFLESVPYRESQRHVDQANVFVNTSEHEGVPNTFIHSGLGHTAILSLVVDPDGMFQRFQAGVCTAGKFQRLVERRRKCSPTSKAVRRAGRGGPVCPGVARKRGQCRRVPRRTLTMIRVLHVIDHLDLGGAQTALLDMLRHRDSSAFDVEVAVMHGRGPFADALEELGIKVHSLARKKWPPAYVTEFVRLLRGADFAVVHFHLQGANWIAKPLAALAGQRILIAHEHSSGDLRFRGLGSLIPDATTHFFSLRIIAVSKGVRDFLTRWEAIPPDLIELVPNAVDDKVFHPASEEERHAARKRFSVPAEAFVAGGIGRLAQEKNFILLPELAMRHSDIYFLVAGSGPERDRIAALVAKLGLGTRVRLLGTILDRACFYHALDAFVLPSLYEGLPMALLEAMSSGVPILSSRLEGISAVVAEEKEGLLARPGDINDFSRQLGRLKESSALRRELATAAQAKALSQFSASVAARIIENIYRQELALAKTKRGS